MKALVTGAAAGLGNALCRQLLSEGALVAAVDNDRAGLGRFAAEAASPDLIVLHTDLSRTQSLPGEIAQWSAFGPFDLVVLNAGISATGRFEEIDADDHSGVITVNATAPMITASTLARRHAVASGGVMVFIASVSHHTGYPGAASYAASKDALAVYAKSIEKPFAQQGIHVMRVFPGPLRTAHAERHAPPGADAQRRMVPEAAAQIILAAARARRRRVYPGWTAKLVAVGGMLAPGRTTEIMRRNIYEKLTGKS